MNPAKFSKTISLILVGGFGSFVFYNYHNVAKDLFAPSIHPTKDYAEKLIKLDKRITNFCGYNYKISGFKIIENTDKYQSYRMNLEGIRGMCKILVKVQKLDQEELKFINDQQKKIASLPYEQRKREPFVPVDFKDILIPTNETLIQIKERIEEVKPKLLNENDLAKNDDFELALLNNKNSENKFDKLDKLFNKIANLPNDSPVKENILNDFNNAINIKENDTFYRFMNISVSFSEDVIFNIRPLTVKFRNYELIDTEYSDKNFLDVFKKINKINKDFNIKKKYEISAEEAKEEIKVSRQNLMQGRLEKRQKYFKYQVIMMIGMLFGARSYMNAVNYQKIYKGVSDNLKKNKILKNKLGDKILIPYLSFRYNLFKRNFTFRCIVQNGDKKIIVKGKSLPNADNVLPSLNFYDTNNKLIKI